MARSCAAGCYAQPLKRNSLGIERQGIAKTVPGFAPELQAGVEAIGQHLGSKEGH